MEVIGGLNMTKNIANITRECIAWIMEWFDKNGPDSPAVIGISGGKDSSVVAALCVLALGKSRVIGVQMPDGIQSDISDSDAIIRHLDIKSYCVNIGGTCDSIRYQMKELGLEDTYVARTNLPPRVRMTTLYNLSQRVNGRVANTCNLSEDYIGWSTKWGDAVGDFSPISKLTCTEVIQMGEYLEIPDHLIHKIPSDGLCGKTDEEKFGFSYKVLDEYIRTGYINDSCVKDKIDSMHCNPVTRSKLIPIAHFDPKGLKPYI